MRELSNRSYQEMRATLALVALLCLALVAALAMGCEGDTITNNNAPLPDRGSVTKTVTAGGTCKAVLGGTAIQCSDSSFCQSSTGVAERCSRISWSCLNTLTGIQCGNVQNKEPGSTHQFTGLTPFTNHLIDQVAWRENGDHDSQPHNVFTGQ